MSENKNNKDSKTFNLPTYINVPSFLYQDTSLDRTALLLASFIYSLHTSQQTIYASNSYLSSMLNVNIRKIPENLAALESKGYIIREGQAERRQIKWLIQPNNKPEIIIDEDLNTHADNGIPPMPTTACPPCRQRHPYNKDYNKDNIREEKLPDATHPQTTQLDIIRKENPLTILMPDKYLIMQHSLNEQCLIDNKCNELFKNKFDKVDVTLQEMLYECVMFYAMKPNAQNVSPHRFRAWIKRERVEIYEKKPDSVAHKLWRDLNDDEKTLISEYKHFQKYPLMKSHLSEAKQKEAKELIHLLQSTQNMRAI